MTCDRCGHASDDHGSLTCFGSDDCTCRRADYRHHRHEALPYGDTAGYSGSATSRERAEAEAEDGTAHARQRITLILLREAGETGLTVVDLRETTGWHHGQASGVLSGLHKVGTITRLSGREYRRDRCEPYVMPEFAAERPTAVHGSERITVTPDERDALVAFRAEVLAGRFTSATWDALLAAGERLA